MGKTLSTQAYRAICGEEMSQEITGCLCCDGFDLEDCDCIQWCGSLACLWTPSSAELWWSKTKVIDAEPSEKP